ncbi:putative phytol kinase 3 chloroplastic-like, partial [Trifolium medium]|nr:putative phytol kinase 3 chloroplastic-like [Trifolium medium]
MLQQLYLLALFSSSLDCGKKLQNEDILIRTDRWGSYFAASVMGVNIFRMLVIGLGIWKDEATVKSMSRFGDY